MTLRFGFLVVFFLFVSCVVPTRLHANDLVGADTMKFDAMSFKLKHAIEIKQAVQRFPVDTVPEKIDSIKKHSPRRAALYSAVVPGLGQIYNKQYWKTPIVYAGGAVAGYLIYYNYNVYANLRKAFRYRRDNDSTTSNETFTVKTIGSPLEVNLENFTDGEVLELQSTYRRDLDLSVLLAFGIYAINIVDAVVYAHLYDFDVSDDLTLRVQPDFRYAKHNRTVTPAVQFGLTYRF